jgi:hypothetical protein
VLRLTVKAAYRDKEVVSAGAASVVSNYLTKQPALY